MGAWWKGGGCVRSSDGSMVRLASHAAAVHTTSALSSSAVQITAKICESVGRRCVTTLQGGASLHACLSRGRGCIRTRTYSSCHAPSLRNFRTGLDRPIVKLRSNFEGPPEGRIGGGVAPSLMILYFCFLPVTSPINTTRSIRGARPWN